MPFSAVPQALPSDSPVSHRAQLRDRSPRFEAPPPRQLPGAAKTMHPQDKGEIPQLPSRSILKKGQHRPFVRGTLKAPASWRRCRGACVRRLSAASGQRDSERNYGKMQTASRQRPRLRRPRGISLLCCEASLSRETCHARPAPRHVGAPPVPTSQTSAFLDVNSAVRKRPFSGANRSRLS